MDFELTHAKTHDDLVAVADLMAKVFASRSYFDFYKGRMDYQTKDPFFRPEFSRVIRVDGQIVSHVSIIEKHLRIGSAVVKVAGIGDVCTHPEFRKHGFTRILMDDAIRYMAANRFPLSMLYGIMGFYHKFGYIEASDSYKTSVAVKHLAGIGESALTVRPYAEGDLKTLNRLYNEAFAGKTLAAERVEKAWYNIAKPETCFVAVGRRNQPAGYVVTSAPPAPPTLGFHVKEAVAADGDTAAALTAFLRERAKTLHMGEIEVHQRPDSCFIEYLRDFGATQTTRVFAEGEGQAMLRIVLLRELLENLQDELTRRLLARANPPAAEVAFKTDIGQAALVAQRGRIRLTQKPTPNAVVIRTPQNWLTRLVIGHWGVESFLRRANVKRLPDPARSLLETLFPVGTPYTGQPDYF